MPNIVILFYLYLIYTFSFTVRSWVPDLTFFWIRSTSCNHLRLYFPVVSLHITDTLTSIPSTMWIYAERPLNVLRCNCLQCLYWWINERRKPSKSRRDLPEDEERLLWTICWYLYNVDKLIWKGEFIAYIIYLYNFFFFIKCIQFQISMHKISY